MTMDFNLHFYPLAQLDNFNISWMQMAKLFSNGKGAKSLGNPDFSEEKMNVIKDENVKVLSKCDLLLKAAVQKCNFLK